LLEAVDCWKPSIGRRSSVEATASSHIEDPATSKIVRHVLVPVAYLHATPCFATYWKPSIGRSGRVKDVACSVARLLGNSLRFRHLLEAIDWQLFCHLLETID
jgi:hypothetical protein